MKVFQIATEPVFVPVTIVLETEKEYETFKSHVQAVDMESLERRTFDKHTAEEAMNIFTFGVNLYSKLIRKDGER